MREQQSERGAALIHVAIMIVGLFAFTGFVIDYGQYWVARRQAQNAADAAAHAGAVALAFDSDDKTPDGAAYQSALTVATSHQIWNAAPPDDAVEIDFVCPEGRPGDCVRAQVYRDTEHGNAMATSFLKLVGLNVHGVRATATAQTMPANATKCLKPWMLPDKWIDEDGNGEYSAGDTYDLPGYTETDIGTELVIHPSGGNAVEPSHYNIINDVGESNSGSVYEDQITNCLLEGWIGKTMSDVPGGKQGPTHHGVQALIDQDLTATWNGTTVTGPYGLASPRVIILALYNPETFWTAKQSGNGDTFDIVNLVAMFLEDVKGNGEITGIIVGKGSDYRPGVGQAPNGAQFLHAIHLIR
jgi:hypothetical protein